MVLYGLDGMTHRSQAYGLLAVGLREHWDLEQLPSIARGKRGKPLFPDFPQLRFNLSHSGPRALCALDRDEVGVDIQQITLRRSAFLDRLLSPEERAWLLGLGDDPEAFTQLWTLKESFCKFTGLGLTRPVSAIPVPLPRQILPSGACLPSVPSASPCSPAPAGGPPSALLPAAPPPSAGSHRGNSLPWERKSPKSEKSPLHFGRSLL